VVQRQHQVTRYLLAFDHQVLPDALASAEDIACAILEGLDCAKVEVLRPLEGLFATAERLPD